MKAKNPATLITPSGRQLGSSLSGLSGDQPLSSTQRSVLAAYLGHGTLAKLRHLGARDLESVSSAFNQFFDCSCIKPSELRKAADRRQW